MPKLRDVSYRKVVKLLKRLGYVKLRQSGSHIIMKADAFISVSNSDKVAIVADDPINIGTLLSIIRSVSEQTGIDDKTLKKMMEEI